MGKLEEKDGKYIFHGFNTKNPDDMKALEKIAKKDMKKSEKKGGGKS